jgi:hypothetical protein
VRRSWSVVGQPRPVHTASGSQSTNYQTRIFGVRRTRKASVSKSAISGTASRSATTPPIQVLVLGYQNEPYLRIGPHGVARNDRSPATFLNRTTLLPTGPAPKSYDATAPPQWTQLSSSPVALWHDHRAHWMGLAEPPVVQRDPGEPHVIDHWTIPLRIDGQPATLAGEVIWVPGPSAWPGIAGASVIAFLVVLLGRIRKHPRTLAVVLAVSAGAAITHAVGAWEYPTASISSRIGTISYELAAVALALITLALLIRTPNLSRISPHMLLTGIFITIGAGLANVTSLFRSQVPTTLAPNFARLLVVSAIGSGIGLAITAAIHLRTPNQPQRAATPGPPPQVTTQTK